jgi:hypothetical protein
VTVHNGRLRSEVRLERDVLDDWVFVFEEDQFEEHSYDVV